MCKYNSAEALKERLDDTRRWLDEMAPLSNSLAILRDWSDEYLRAPENERDRVEFPRWPFEKLPKLAMRLTYAMDEFVDDLKEYGLWSNEGAEWFGRLTGGREYTSGMSIDPFDFVYSMESLTSRMVDNVKKLRRAFLRDLDELAARRLSPGPRGQPGSEPSMTGGEPGTERLDVSDGTVPTTSHILQTEEDRSTGHATDPNEPMARSSSVGYLGLVLGSTPGTIRRQGYPNEVKLYGRGGRGLLLWGLFQRLLTRGERGCQVPDLREHWEELGGLTNDPSDSAIHDAIWRLRREIKPLGVAVVPRQGSYLLAEDS
jgi:hypothetical protein